MARGKKKRGNFSQSQQSKNLIHFRQRLYGGSFSPISVFHDLQKFRDYQEIVAASRMFSSPTNPFHKYIFGTLFAKSYADIRSRHNFVYTEDLQRDLDWMALSIVRYAEEISQFVAKSVTFQRAYLLGDYKQANHILEEIVAVVIIFLCLKHDILS